MPVHPALPKAQQEAATKSTQMGDGRIERRSYGGVGPEGR